MRDCAKNISNLEKIPNNKDWDKTLAIDLGNFGSYPYRSQVRDTKKFCMMISLRLSMTTVGLLKSLRIAL